MPKFNKLTLTISTRSSHPFLNQKNNQFVSVHNTAGILLCLFCICRCQSTGSGCTLFRKIGHSILFGSLAHPNDCVEFFEESKIFNTGVTVCINFNGYR